MSLILDALRRSEKARRVLGAAQPPPAPEPGAPARRGWVLGAVALLLVLNAVLLAWFTLRPGPTAPPPAPGAQGEVRPLAGETVGTATGAAAPRADANPMAPPAPSSAAVPLEEAGPALRARLASLHVDVHGWAEDPAQRFVLINLKRRVVGDALEGGATLVEIVPEGAVVELDGQRVLLPRQ
jgi:general secretion pathway protein B